MQISRAIYSSIIGILQGKDIEAKVAIALADSICEEIEKTEPMPVHKTPIFQPVGQVSMKKKPIPMVGGITEDGRVATEYMS